MIASRWPVTRSSSLTLAVRTSRNRSTSVLVIGPSLCTNCGTIPAGGQPLIEPVGSLDREALIHWIERPWNTTLGGWRTGLPVRNPDALSSKEVGIDGAGARSEHRQPSAQYCQ